ncbi:MAG: ParB N-terminal domain-containing protein [Roseibium sp.]
MAEFKTLPLSRVTISTRLRDIDEDLARVISGSIAEYGLMNPISVRATPRAKGGSYTLIAGLHRLRATELLGLETIDCFVLKADQSDAQLLEIAENPHRNELSVIDRAVAVLKYRELWEEQHGQISAGRPSANKSGQDVPITNSFSKYTAIRLGLHPKTIKRLSQIALNLHADLRAAVRASMMWMLPAFMSARVPPGPELSIRNGGRMQRSALPSLRTFMPKGSRKRSLQTSKCPNSQKFQDWYRTQRSGRLRTQNQPLKISILMPSSTVFQELFSWCRDLSPSTRKPKKSLNRKVLSTVPANHDWPSARNVKGPVSRQRLWVQIS